jgi:hypothetical protein
MRGWKRWSRIWRCSARRWLLLKVSECDTTEAAMEHIDARGFSHIYNHLAERICQRVMQMLRFTKIRPCDAIMFSFDNQGPRQQSPIRGRLWRICMLTVAAWGLPLCLNDAGGAGGGRAGRCLVGGSAIWSSSLTLTANAARWAPILPNCWIAQRMHQRVVVLASGDPLFYGIGTRLIAHFGIEQVRIIPGISAVQYLCAKTGIDMNDIWLTSSHGRDVDFDALVRQPRWRW